MSHTEADLASATAKLASLEFTAAEAEAIAAVLAEEPDEVSGFSYDNKNEGNGFLLEVSGLMRTSTNWSWGMTQSGFTATDDLARVKNK